MLLFVSRRILGIHQIVSILVFFVHMTARCKLGFAYFVRHRPNCKTNFPTRRWKSMIPHTDEESFISEGDLKINAEPGHVYFVATPIGNSADISERARRLLTSADLICAEDTRNTAQLLKRIKIPFKRLISHHEHNEFKSIDKIRDYALSGQSIVVVSDAGTPGISDPGAPLAAALAQSNIPLHPVPGPSAVIAALSICGYSGDMFTFMGFLPVKGSERQRRISTLVNTQHTVVIYEAPHRVLKTFLDILTAGGDNTKSRQVVCCREITKLHEEIRRGTVTEIYEWLQQIDIAHQEGKGIGIRGEFTIVFGPDDSQAIDVKALRDSLLSTSSDSENMDPINNTKADIIARLTASRNEGMQRSESVRKAAKELGVPKSIVYDIALKITWT